MSLGFEKFSKDVEEGEIHQRDRLQFELKSIFRGRGKQKKEIFSQEVYFFIPNSLQINEETYTKAEFYRDQTNLIRYKTPELSLKELMQPSNRNSPLTRLFVLLEKPHEIREEEAMKYELKLLGNVVRACLRKEVRSLLKKLETEESPGLKLSLEMHTLRFCKDLKLFRKLFLEKKEELETQDRRLRKHFEYVDEFISNFINFYLSGFLERLRLSSLHKLVLDQEIFDILAFEKLHREEKGVLPFLDTHDPVARESIYYRTGLLNKFVFDALHLTATRSSQDTRFRNIIGSFAAAIAMLFFFVLFIWQGGVFIVNSIPFILITVFLYVLKDRLKEEVKIHSYRQFHKWFPDYTTKIASFDKKPVGELQESFSHVDEGEVAGDILKVRNRESHPILETFKLPEQILYCKRGITLFHQGEECEPVGLHLIFRFNIHRFLVKADDPVHPYVTVDPVNREIVRELLPKVYHVNVVLKNSYMRDNGEEASELRKFRLILDKDGIKRVEQVRG